MLLRLLRAPVTVVWLGLVAITVFSWRLGTDQGTNSHHLAAVILFVLAFTKVRFIGMYFMELRGAPRPLRLLFQGWCVVVCTALIGMYLGAA